MQPLMHLGQLLVLEEAVLVHVHCFGLRQETRGIDHRGLALLELGTPTGVFGIDIAFRCGIRPGIT